MSLTWFIAKRYLLAPGSSGQASRRTGFVSFITAFSILGVTIGTAAVIIALSIINGFENEIKEKVFSFASHVQIIGFQNQPLSDYEKNVDLIKERIPDVLTVAPFVAKEAMIRVEDKVDGIVLRGIDPGNEVEATQRYLVEGRYFVKENAQPELVVGKKLSTKLGIRIGDKAVVFGLPRQRSENVGMIHPRAMVFQVVGIFESGMAEYDDIYAYTTIENAQKLFQMGNAIHGYEVLLRDMEKAATIGSEMQKLLGYPHYARTAAHLYRNLFAWIELQKKPAPIFLGLIIIVATVNIIGALLMLVLEKAHGIGVLKSIGARPSDIRGIFLLQGTLIGGVGVLLGDILAYALCWIQLTFKPLSLPSDIYFMSTVPILMRPEHFVVVSALVLFLCAAASLVPSRAAARLDPITTFRFS